MPDQASRAVSRSFQRLKVQKAIRRLLDDPPERLLVLDDGSHFLEAATAFALRLSYYS